MGHRVLRAAVCVTLAALVSSLASTAALGASPDVVAPGPPPSPTGTYIVLLDDAPAATYEGGTAGLPSTAAEEGEKLDTRAARVQKYAAFLEARQREVAAEAGVEPLAMYQIVLNGFSAQLTPDAAARVAAIEGVLAVYPDEVLRPDTTLRSDSTPSQEQEIGDAATASAITAGGGGVVIGLIDTGIAPDNPSFGGERLGSASGAEPYLDGNEVVVEKADGREFRSTRVSADDWQRADYSTKLVAAQFFAAGRPQRASTSPTTSSRLGTATAMALGWRVSPRAMVGWAWRSTASASARSRVPPPTRGSHRIRRASRAVTRSPPPTTSASRAMCSRRSTVPSATGSTSSASRSAGPIPDGVPTTSRCTTPPQPASSSP